MLRFARAAVPATAAATLLGINQQRKKDANDGAATPSPALTCARFVKHSLPALIGAGSLSVTSRRAGPAGLAFSESAEGAEPKSDSLVFGSSGADSTAEEELESEADNLCPGDFSNAEDDKTLQVHPSDGLNLSIQSSVGGGGRDSAAVAINGNISSGGAHVVYILVDQRSPTLQAVLQQGQEGKMLKLVSRAEPLSGLNTEVEGVVAYAGLQSAKVTAKYSGPDFFTSGTLSVPFGGGNAPNGEFSYHQTVAPGITAGGSLQALFTPPMLPVPAGVQQLFWGGFGSWTSQRRDSAVFLRYGQQPRPEGGVVESLNVLTWHKATRNLEVAADASLATTGYITPQSSNVGCGARYTFEGQGGLNPVLTVHANAEKVVGISWQKPFAGPGSSTFMRTTLSGVFDHKQKDFKTGVSVELYY